MQLARRYCGGSYNGRKYWRSSRPYRLVWSALRLAARRIIGAREIRELGHEVRLMPPSYVAPYVKRGKTDAADAAGIGEAVTRPTMRFVPVKAEHQAVFMLHQTRDL